MTDLDRLTLAISQKFGSSIPPKDYGWHAPALNVLDCVLSLNRRYNAFVLPRIYAFQAKHRDIYFLGHLRTQIDRFPTPNHFSITELNYNHPDRARILNEVLNFMIRIQVSHRGETEERCLLTWAITAIPQDAYKVGIKGFGLAGFQYMRMLFGAQTTKPDVHITRYVSEAVGHPVTQEIALHLLEQAAKIVGLPVRELDNSIWQSLSAK